MEKATGGKVKVNIYAADQLTNGNQSEGIQALMNGDPVQISMHSNLIYSAFDPRFNVVSLPFVYDSYDEVVKWMSYEQAIQVAITGKGKFSGKTMGRRLRSLFSWCILLWLRKADFQKVWVFVRARIVPWPQIFNS